MPATRPTLVAARLSTLALLLTLTTAGTHTQSTQPPRPDIVVIMADDLDVESLDTAVAHGLMPNLVHYVLAVGTRFTESFVTESLCCPSRSTFLTGLYPHNHGVVRNSGRAGGFNVFQEHFRQSAPLARWLEASGYRTAHVGKYLNGYTDYTIAPHGWSEWRGLVDSSTYCMYNYRVSKNGTELLDFGQDPSEPPHEYQTDVLARMAEEIVATTDQRPLFLSVAPLAPHRESSCVPDTVRPAPRHVGTVNLPLPSPPSLNEEDLSDKPRWMRRLPVRDLASLHALYNDRIASLRAVDDLIGTVASALSAAGRLERTAFLFTSDNGYLLGLHRWESKILLYEESIRVPLAITIPAVPGGASVDRVGRLALNTDLAPTIVDLARATPAFIMDGRSLLPLVRGTDPQWRARFLVEFPPLPAPDADALGLDFDLPPTFARFLPPFAAVRAGDARDPARLVYGETVDASGTQVTDRELYDLEADPYQLDSLHNDGSPLRVRQRRVLKRHLDALKGCRGGTCQVLEQ
mgnify:CR=1 FL=1